MKRLITLIAAGLVLSGCGPEPQAPPPETKNRLAEESDRRVAEERKQREQTEARLHEQEAHTSRWQFAAMLSVSVAGFALIFGTILGSRARHDAKKK